MLLHCWFGPAYSGTAFNVHHLRPLGEINPQSGSPSSNFNLFAYLAILHRIEATASSMKEHTHAPCHPSYSPVGAPGWLPWIGNRSYPSARPEEVQTRRQLTISKPWPARPSANLPIHRSRSLVTVVLFSRPALRCRSAPIYPRRTSTWGPIGALCGKSQVLPRFGEFLSTRPPSERCACLDSGEA